MAPAKGVEGEQKGGKSKGLKKPGRPPKAEKKPVVEGSSKGPGKKGKKAKKNIETYKIYIYKVLKQVSHCFLHLASSLSVASFRWFFLFTCYLCYLSCHILVVRLELRWWYHTKTWEGQKCHHGHTKYTMAVYEAQETQMFLQILASSWFLLLFLDMYGFGAW